MELVIKGIKMVPGDTVKIKGKILENIERFRVNLGTDKNNLGLHFNPRFNYGNDTRVIVLNSRKRGNWESEQKDSNFPYEWGQEVEIIIVFRGDKFEIKLHNDHQIEFPNKLEMEKLTYMSVIDMTVSDVQLY